MGPQKVVCEKGIKLAIDNAVRFTAWPSIKYDWALHNGRLRTPPGPKGSNGTNNVHVM